MRLNLQGRFWAPVSATESASGIPYTLRYTVHCNAHATFCVLSVGGAVVRVTVEATSERTGGNYKNVAFHIDRKADHKHIFIIWKI